MDSEILIYQTEDGETKIDTRLENETVWLSIEQMATLFQKGKSTVNEHIINIFKEGELDKVTSLRKIGNSDFSTKPTNFYNLDVIISVGYRVKSLRGTQFRIWATKRLREYIVKGFAMDDNRLKEAGRGNYFDELLSRIRDIRSSEKVFWCKVLDIYATSIDYNPDAVDSQMFFKIVQNKMHWAAHGKTAAEVIFSRIDSSKPNLGLTSFSGEVPSRKETAIAKNYLNKKELDVLNRMVTAYLEVAELQALSGKPMYMKDWTSRLDDFLKMTGNDILDHAGKISHKIAVEKAHSEYEKFKRQEDGELSRAEKDFVIHLEQSAKGIKKQK